MSDYTEIGLRVRFDPGNSVNNLAAISHGIRQVGDATAIATNGLSNLSKTLVQQLAGLAGLKGGMAGVAGAATTVNTAMATAASSAEHFAQVTSQFTTEADRIREVARAANTASDAWKALEANAAASAKRAAAAEFARRMEEGAKISLRSSTMMERALSTMSTMFNRVKEAAKNSADSIKTLGDKHEKETQRIVGNNSKTGASFNTVRLDMSRFVRYWGVAMTGLTLKKVMDASDQFTALSSRLHLVSGTTAEFVKAQDRLYQIAQTTRAPLEETTRLYYRMAGAMRDMGKGQSDVLRVTELLTKSLKISGASGSETAAALQQISQAFQAGVLNGDEFRSVAENMPRVLDALSKSLHVSKGALREMSAQGKLTTDVVISAVMSQAESIDKEFNRIPVTISESMTRIKNAFLVEIGAANETTKASMKVVEGFGYIEKLMPLLGKGFENLVVSIGAVAKALNEVAEAYERFRTSGITTIFDSPPSSEGWEDKLRKYKEEYVNTALTMEEWEKRRKEKGFFNLDETYKDTLWKNIEEGIFNTTREQQNATKAMKEYRDVVQQVIEYSTKLGIPAELGLAVAYQESKFNPRATSGKDARGVMQIIDGTASAYYSNPAVNSYDPEKNIPAGLKYLAEQLKKFGGDITLALAAYNAGPNNVIKAGNRVPKINETQNYVTDITMGSERNPGVGFFSNLIESISTADSERIKKHAGEMREAMTQAQEDVTKMTQIESQKRVAQMQNDLKVLELGYKNFQANSETQMQYEMPKLGLEEQQKMVDDFKRKNDEYVQSISSLEKKIASTQGVERLQEEKRLIEEKIKVAEKFSAVEGSEKANLDQLLQRRKEIDAEMLVEREKLKSADIETQSAMAENQRSYQERARAIAMDEIEYQQKVADAYQAREGIAAEQQRREIAMVTERMQADQQRQEADMQAAMVGKEGVALGQMQYNLEVQRRANKQAMLEREQTANVENLAITNKLLAAERQMLTARLSSVQNRQEELAIKQRIYAIDQQINSTSSQAQGFDIARQQEEYANASDAAMRNAEAAAGRVVEMQLRLNAAYEEGVQQANLFAQQSEQAFGQVGKSMGQVVKGFAQFQQQQYQTARNLANEKERLRELVSKGVIKDKEAQERQSEAEREAVRKNAQYQIAALGDVTQAMQGFFEEGTAGYEAMGNATKVFRLFEMAMAVESIIAQLTGAETLATANAVYTVQRVGELQAQGEMEALVGVTHQATGGDVYSAPARMAVMAAMMAALGFAVAGAFAGGGQKRDENNYNGRATGTVLGDPTGTSKSIEESLKVLEENSTNDLSYTAAMLRSLQNIESSMVGVTRATYMGGLKPNIGSGLGTTHMLNDISKYFGMAIMGPMGYFMNSIDPLSKMLFSTTKSITDFGLRDLPQTLASILSGGFKGLSYTDVTTKNKMFGMTVSSKTNTNYAGISDELSRQMTMVFRSISDSLVEGGKIFGLDGADFNARLANFIVDFGMISTKDLKPEELQKKFEDAFSAQADRMAKAFFPQITKFQQAGEGAYQTFIRVADGVARATGILEYMNVQVMDFMDIANKTGDVSGEMVRDSILAYENLSENTRLFVEELTGSAEQIAEAYMQIREALALMQAAKFDPAGFSRSMTNVAGGLSNFIDLMQNYNQNFLSKGEQITAQTIQLAESFGRLGYELPKTREDYRALMESIDTTSVSGQKLFGQLLKLNPAFAELVDSMDAAAQSVEELKSKYAGYSDPFAAISTQVKQIMSDFGTMIAPITGQIAGNQANLDRNVGNWNRDAVLEEHGKEYLKKLDQRSKNEKKIAEIEKKITEETEKDEPNAKRLKALEKMKLRIEKQNDKLDQQMQLTSKMENLQSQKAKQEEKLAAIDEKIAREMEKSKPNQARIARLQKKREGIVNALDVTDSAIEDIETKLDDIRQKIKDAQEKNSNDLADLQAQEAELVKQRFTVIIDTLQGMWDEVTNTLRQAQQNLAQQIAELQGTAAVANLANWNMQDAQTQLSNYDAQVASGERTANWQQELALIQSLQGAIMSRYNAEMALIQEQQQAYIEAETKRINEQLDAEIKAYNKVVDGQIKAVNKMMDAELKARSKAMDARIKDRNKELELELKAITKAQEAKTKLLQKQQDKERSALQKVHDEQMKVLTDELDALNNLRDALSELKKSAKDMMFGSSSILSPEAQLAEMQSKYADLVSRTKGGDAAAAQELNSFYSQYLDAAKGYYGGNEQYADIFRKVQADLEYLGGMDTTDPNSIQARIDALAEQQASEMEMLQEKFDAQMEVIREETQALQEAAREVAAEQIDAWREAEAVIVEGIREGYAETVDSIRDAANDYIDAMREAAQKQIDDLSDPEKNEAMKALKADTIAKLQELQDRLLEAQGHAAEQFTSQIDLLKKQIDFDEAQLQALNALVESAGKAVIPIPGYAGGGFVPGGLALVGEEGPELVNFRNPAQVTNAADTKRLLERSESDQAWEKIHKELQALVNLQVKSNPQMLDKLDNIGRSLSSIERVNKVQNIR